MAAAMWQYCSKGDEASARTMGNCGHGKLHSHTWHGLKRRPALERLLLSLAFPQVSTIFNCAMYVCTVVSVQSCDCIVKKNSETLPGGLEIFNERFCQDVWMHSVMIRWPCDAVRRNDLTKSFSENLKITLQCLDVLIV